MENNATKYMKYAIGEIILVVIGILIALNINNWNEERKNKAQQKILLTQLLEDAVADSVFYSARINGIEMLDSVLIYIDNLDKNIDIPQSFKLNTNGTGRILPFSYINFSSNIISEYNETYNKITSPEIKKVMRAYNLIYFSFNRSVDLLNVHIDSHIEPLRFVYYRELRENRKTKSIKILNKIYKDERILSVLDKMLISLDLLREKGIKLIEVNNNFIQLLQKQLKEN